MQKLSTMFVRMIQDLIRMLKQTENVNMNYNATIEFLVKCNWMQLLKYDENETLRSEMKYLKLILKQQRNITQTSEIWQTLLQNITDAVFEKEKNEYEEGTVYMY